jgi:hypothetical protein
MTSPIPLTEEEKTALAIASFLVGSFFGGITSVMTLGLCLMFLSAGPAFGVSIVVFFPVTVISAKLNVRVYLTKRAKEQEVTP